jgi:hypothetical protein
MGQNRRGTAKQGKERQKGKNNQGKSRESKKKPRRIKARRDLGKFVCALRGVEAQTRDREQAGVRGA